MPIPRRINSNHLKWYKEIEKSLFRFFGLFDDLCSLCYKETIRQIERGGKRSNMEYWCCCVADNQVHDHWIVLNPIQEVSNGLLWYEEVKRKHSEWQEGMHKRRLPGNGPCPAICTGGCCIKSCRPITCTTQLCEKMLFVLNKSGVCDLGWHKALQIEEIIKLPDILQVLYGVRTGKVDFSKVELYLKSVKKLELEFSGVDFQHRKSLIEESIAHFFK